MLPSPCIKDILLSPSWKVSESVKSQLCWCSTSSTWHTNVFLTNLQMIRNKLHQSLDLKYLTIKQTVNLWSFLQSNSSLKLWKQTNSLLCLHQRWLPSDWCLILPSDATPQTPRQNLSTPRPHLQIILTRCCFLFPQKSVTGWPSIWNSNQLITCSVENVDIWFAWRISIMNRLFLLKSPFKKLDRHWKSPLTQYKWCFLEACIKYWPCTN